MSQEAKPLTREQQLRLIYRHTHKDYKGSIGGVKGILVLRAGGSCAVPLDQLTDAEIASHLPYALKKEAERIEAKQRKGGAA